MALRLSSKDKRFKQSAKNMHGKESKKHLVRQSLCLAITDKLRMLRRHAWISKHQIKNPTILLSDTPSTKSQTAATHVHGSWNICPHQELAHMKVQKLGQQDLLTSNTLDSPSLTHEVMAKAKSSIQLICQ